MNIHEKTTRTILVHKAPLNSINEQDEVSDTLKTNNLEYNFFNFFMSFAK